jgi:hypothetical protein
MNVERRYHEQPSASSEENSSRYSLHVHRGRVVAMEDPREFGLDTTLAETFPCSDPLSSIPNPDTELH